MKKLIPLDYNPYNIHKHKDLSLFLFKKLNNIILSNGELKNEYIRVYSPTLNVFSFKINLLKTNTDKKITTKITHDEFINNVSYKGRILTLNIEYGLNYNEKYGLKTITNVISDFFRKRRLRKIKVTITPIEEKNIKPKKLNNFNSFCEYIGSQIHDYIFGCDNIEFNTELPPNIYNVLTYSFNWGIKTPQINEFNVLEIPFLFNGGKTKEDYINNIKNNLNICFFKKY